MTVDSPRTSRGLEARALEFVYPNGTRVIEGWDAHIEPGSVTALTGPSGSGKSTLLYILGLLHRQISGELLVDGERMTRKRDRERAHMRAHMFGFVFQDAVLDPTRTVLDNVVEGALYRRQPRTEALRSARELMEHLGVELRADHRPGQVSGGQAQRVALCRALLSSPRFILADEPTGNLDPLSREVVIGTLRSSASAGACVVIATHDPAVIAACDTRIDLADVP